MRTAVTQWDAFCFFISGGDIHALEVHPDIAREERRVARGYAAVMLGLLALNFICTGLSAYDIFIDLQPSLTLTGYLVVVVLPLAILWTLIVFCILRFLVQIGHDVDSGWWTRLLRLITMLLACCSLPLLGLMASAPIQVRALADDIRLSSVMARWDRLSTELIEIQLAEARVATPNHHDCVTPLMQSVKPNALMAPHKAAGMLHSTVHKSETRNLIVVQDPPKPAILAAVNLPVRPSASIPVASPEKGLAPANSIAQVFECRAQVEADMADPARKAYSLRLLEAIQREIRDDGLIARLSLAFEAAPGTCWLIALVMMFLYSAPILTRLMARTRAYEYLQKDRARRDLMSCAGIELYAHEAFDLNGMPVPLHRYRHVEAAQRYVQANYETQTAATRLRFEQQREAAYRLI